MNPQLPLAGVVVLDVTLARAGPTCSRHLADWGADVIRVEPPVAVGEDVVGRRNGPDFQNLHRNKRGIHIDLKSEDGYEVFKKLVARADVLVENMRPPVKHRLKISYDDLKAINPRLVYGSVSGFGQDGPYATRGGVDQIAQGMGGLMSVTGIPGHGPVRVGIPINDLVAGTLLALSIMMALYQREHTGEGRWVHTSLLESAIYMLDFQAARYLVKGEVAGQEGNDHPVMTPIGLYPTKDGYINLSASWGRLWERLLDAIGKPEWRDKKEWQRMPDRTKDRVNLTAALSEVLRQQPSAYWLEKFEEAGIPSGPMYTIDQVFADPQVQHLGMAVPTHSPVFGDTRLVGSGMNFAGVKKEIRSHTPEPGAHTDEVLQWLGYSQAEIGKLRGSGAVAPPV